MIYYSKCPNCGGELSWVWIAEQKTNSAWVECQNCSWWSGSHMSISDALNGLQRALSESENELAQEVKNNA